MSAYGALSRPVGDSPLKLPTTRWPHPRDPTATLILFHLDSIAIVDTDTGNNVSPGLFDHLHAVFADEVDKGLTYPQRDMRDPDAFRAYFFVADVVVAIAVLPGERGVLKSEQDGERKGDSLPVPRETEGEGVEVEIEIERARGGRSWEECVVGFYYVKPNYPGRSSHICNAGFVVPPLHRGNGYGNVLARSYLYYAPRLGYEASVFNLVYVNNVASIRLWERLGFEKAGLIPRAGILRRTDGPGEEYVDAWVFYKRFNDREGETSISLRP